MYLCVFIEVILTKLYTRRIRTNCIDKTEHSDITL